jgi:hypothetical protein
VGEALRRMQDGEHGLAIHPNCGTGLVTAGLLTSVATLIGTSGHGGIERSSRLPHSLLSTMSLILSQPLGLALQQHFTTLGDQATWKSSISAAPSSRSRWPVSA